MKLDWLMLNATHRGFIKSTSKKCSLITYGKNQEFFRRSSIKTEVWLRAWEWSEVLQKPRETEGDFPSLLPSAGESVPVEEQIDKEKAKAEVHALEAAPNNNKAPPSTPALSALPGVSQLTGAEKEKYDAEMAKLYKELDDKVIEGSMGH